MTRSELIRTAKQRHPGGNWITAFAGEIGVSYWTVYRIANNDKAKVSELVEMKVERVVNSDQKHGE
jgi:hypothetical protein